MSQISSANQQTQWTQPPCIKSGTVPASQKITSSPEFHPHNHTDFKRFISARCVRAVGSGLMLAPGHSGSLLLRNFRGFVVEMINGGLTAVDRRSRGVE